MKKLLKIFAFAASACAAYASDELYDMLVQLESAESLIGQKQAAQAGEALLSQKRDAQTGEALLGQKQTVQAGKILLGQSRFVSASLFLFGQSQTADWGGEMLVFKLENTAGLPFWKWRSYVGEYTYAFYVLCDYDKADNWQKIKLFPEIKELSKQ